MHEWIVSLLLRLQRRELGSLFYFFPFLLTLSIPPPFPHNKRSYDHHRQIVMAGKKHVSPLFFFFVGRFSLGNPLITIVGVQDCILPCQYTFCCISNFRENPMSHVWTISRTISIPFLKN